MRIVQANGDPVKGGAKEAELRVTFRERVQPNDDEELVWRATGLFHEAELEDEMILGYPWLCQHKLAVVPGDHALGVGSTDRLIAGWEEGDRGFDPEDERVPDCALRKLRLCVEDIVSQDGSEGDWRVDVLDEDEMVEALNGRDCIDEEEVKLRTMLMSEGAAEWGDHQALVEGLRASIMEAYGVTVLCNEIQPDPPNRGPNCEAIITLKEGAQPKKQRAMPMHGERLEALGKIADE